MIRSVGFVSGIASALLLLTATAWAQPGDNAYPAMIMDGATARIDRLEAELAALRTTVGRLPDVDRPCCERRGGLFGGAAVIFTKPHFKESFEASTVDGLTGTMNLLPFEYRHEPNMRAWLGYAGPRRTGIRATYWDFHQDSKSLALVSDAATTHSAQVVTVTLPAAISTYAPGQTLIADSSLSARTFDLEGTLNANLAGVEIIASGGLRYAALEQDFVAAVVDGGAGVQQLTWERTFEGLGPTLAAEFRKPVGCGGFTLFGAGRGSLLFGKKSLSRFVNPAAGANPPVPFARLDDADEVVPVFSLDLGVEWARQLECGQVFVRGAYEGQLWAEAGAPTLGFLGFEGFSLQAGINR